MANVGSLVVFSVKFLDSAGADADPTVVRFHLREEIDGTELTWLFNASPTEGTHYPVGMNPIVKDSTGDYHVNVVARKPERHTGFWQGSGTIFQTSESVVFIRHSALSQVEP